MSEAFLESYGGQSTEALRAIGCPKTAAMTDDRYYANAEPIADRLFEWIGNNRARIQVP